MLARGLSGELEMLMWGQPPSAVQSSEPRVESRQPNQSPLSELDFSAPKR